MTAPDPRAGLIPSLRRLANTLADIAGSRFELASIELGETLERLLTSLIVAFMAVVLIAASLVAFSALIVFAVDDAHRPVVLAGMGVVYLLVGIGLFGWLRGYLRSWPTFLSATLAELRNDSRALRGETLRGGAAAGSAQGE